MNLNNTEKKTRKKIQKNDTKNQNTKMNQLINHYKCNNNNHFHIIFLLKT